MDRKLYRDGIGIERLPVRVEVGGEFVDCVVVKTEDLLALEALTNDLRDVVACVSADGLDWDDHDQRARLFTQADAAWEQAGGVLRHDDANYDDDERPQ
jgi:hypothetical protein